MNTTEKPAAETTAASKLTRKQFKTFGPKLISGYGKGAMIKATVRYDDECGNGHNSFAITADVYIPGRNDIEAGGCMHEEVAKKFPELAPLIKWHLCGSDGPMYYVANTIYHADQHGATHAWVYYSGQADPLNVGGSKERLVGYEKAEVARKAEGAEGYRVEWDTKTEKVRNLAYARSSAVWSEATDDDLTAPGLKERLEARLPALLVEFRAAVESLGFVW